MAKRLVKSDAVQPCDGGKSLEAAQTAIVAIRALKAESKAAAIVKAGMSRQEGIDRLKNKVEKLVDKYGKSTCGHLNYQKWLTQCSAPF